MESVATEPILDKGILDALYSTYNKREYIHPDPLEFLYQYDDPADREIVGLAASSLSYGNVKQILRSVSNVLDRMEPSPSEFLDTTSEGKIRSAFKGFKHRFTTGDDMTDLLLGVKSVIIKYGSLQECFMSGYSKTDETILPALQKFVNELKSASNGEPCYLLPNPMMGSACKRLNLYLRWMVRRDDVDCGEWYNVPASGLIVPLDRHMHNIGLALELTRRKQPDLRTALEITSAFREIEPEDPVKYDFALTRLGIRDDTDMDLFLTECGVEVEAVID